MTGSDFDKERKEQQLSQNVRVKIDQEAQDIFKNETVARKALSTSGRTLAILGAVLLLVVLISMFLLPYGAISNFLTGLELPYFNYSIADYRDLIVERVGGFFSFFTGEGGEAFGTIFFSFLIIVLAGCAMSASGAVYQGVFQNPMASPTTLGVEAGGIFGGLIYIFFFYDASSYGTSLVTQSSSVTVTTADELIDYWQSQTIFERCGQQLLTLAGCLIGVLLILAISYGAGRGKISTVTLLIAGSIFSVLISEFGQLIQYYLTYYEEDEIRAAAVNNLIGGSYIGGSFTWYEFVFMLVPIGICLILVFSMGSKLNIMSFGSEEARALGVNVNVYRNILIAACTVMTATVISFCGQIAMVGFMAPHFARYLVGPDFKKLVPASTILGGIATMLIYDVCYVTASTGRFNMYTGVVCSIMSVFFMIFYRRRRNADWA